MIVPIWSNIKTRSSLKEILNTIYSFSIFWLSKIKTFWFHKNRPVTSRSLPIACNFPALLVRGARNVARCIMEKYSHSTWYCFPNSCRLNALSLSSSGLPFISFCCHRCWCALFVFCNMNFKMLFFFSLLRLTSWLGDSWSWGITRAIRQPLNAKVIMSC